nr:immunoglobulin heavy chain junction region [Macaca mulatta]MOX94393.1 immunoglobulin heavy chain junction region [Macaca mulatta]MOX94617.1 immunoglobulin heavy chain junction region [Macaca mulatta]MOX96154.1 immunoglobulin heavy chain junction region [Macaca mulatta]
CVRDERGSGFDYW